MNKPHDLAPLMGVAPAAPSLDFATEQIRNGYLAGVTLRTIANPDEPCEVLVSIKLATRIAQLLLDYTLQTQRQQERQRQHLLAQATGQPSSYRPARRTAKKTSTSAIRFEFELNLPCTVQDRLHPLQVYYILDGVRQSMPSVICIPEHYWSPKYQQVRRPKKQSRRHPGFDPERIKRANAQLATLQSRVKVAYLALPEDQRTAENVHRWLTSQMASTPASAHQHAA